MEMIQLTRQIPDPEYGEIGKDENGEMTAFYLNRQLGMHQNMPTNYRKINV